LSNRATNFRNLIQARSTIESYLDHTRTMTKIERLKSLGKIIKHVNLDYNLKGELKRAIHVQTS